MSEKVSELKIVEIVAEQAALRMTRKAITRLQGMEELLSGEDSELANTWDEICVQVQSEHSFAWDAYDQTARAVVAKLVSELPAHEREAIWLQTEAGFEWDCDDAEGRSACPVFEGDIVSYVLTEYVYEKADEWSNERIRAFIDRSSVRD